jgi:hypothetical protein
LNELPVSKSIDVIDVFRAANDGDLWVNKIVELVNKKTGIGDKPGNNKPAVIRAIEYLDKASILESIPVNKQKKLKKLTALGKELVNLMDDFDCCNSVYNELKDMIIDHNFIVGKYKDTAANADKRWEIFRSKLFARGFNKRQVDSFDTEMDFCFILEGMYRENIMNCLLNRYSTILTKHTPNDKANSILLHVIMKYIFNIFSLSKELDKINSEIFDSPERYYSTVDEFRDQDRLPFVPVYETFLENIWDYFESEYDFSIKEIANMESDLLFSMIVLLQPDKEEIEEYVRSFEEDYDYGGPKRLTKIYKNYLNFR